MKKKLNIGFGHKRPKNVENRKRAKMLRHQSVPAHGKTALDKPACVPAAHEVHKAKCPVLGHFGPKHVRWAAGKCLGQLGRGALGIKWH